MHHNFIKLANWTAGFISLGLLLPVLASAHVVVTPSDAPIASESIFSISSPNEGMSPINKVALTIPKGVINIVPTVKNGWIITAQRDGSANNTIHTLIWSGGPIPTGQREDFSFSAQMPASATVIDWKAYQTYADGTVIHWDQRPQSKTVDASGTAGPYSETKITNDLTVRSNIPVSSSQGGVFPLIIATVALITSVFTLLRLKSLADLRKQ